jgi:hypothetical protein
MLFPVGFDNWQIAIFLKGLANTGKSTLVNLIMKMFPQNSHCILASNQEATFGLENVHSKQVFACPDMPRDMSKTLDSALLQSMIPGEHKRPEKRKRLYYYTTMVHTYDFCQ